MSKPSKTIFKQFIIFSFLISVIPTFFISIILFKNLESDVENELRYSYNQIGSQYMYSIREKFTNMERSVIAISKNTIILSQLTDSTSSAYGKGKIVSEEIFKSLLFDGRNEVSNVMVYSKDSREIYGKSVSTWDVAKKEAWYGYYKDKQGKWFIYPSSSNKNLSIASLVYYIYSLDTTSLVQREIGAVKLDANLNRIFMPTFADDKRYGCDIILYDKNNNILYSNVTDEKKNEMFQSAISEALPIEEVFNLKNEFAYNFEIYDVGIKVILAFDNNDLISRKEDITLLFFPIIFILLALLTTVAWLFAKRFSNRVNLLVDKFKVAETGDLSIKDSIYGDDEITVLDEHFSQMIAKLDSLIKDTYIKELERKKLELKNLQLQINPHFLYNTLETISSIGAVNNLFIIGDISGKLGEIFRYSLGKNHGDFVTLEEELKHIENYVFIQKVRYADRLEVFYNVENVAKGCLVPRFILQPIVENAIIHGIDPKSNGGTIEVLVYIEENGLFIRIEDDGVGMSGTMVNNINEMLCRNSGSVEEVQNIGIKNVNSRIKFVYGEEYGVHIESMEHKGSSIVIRLPVKFTC